MSPDNPLLRKIQLVYGDSAVGKFVRFLGYPRITKDEIDYMKSQVGIRVPVQCGYDTGFTKKFYAGNLTFTDYIDKQSEDRICNLYRHCMEAEWLMAMVPVGPPYVQEYKEEIEKILTMVAK